MTGLKYKNLLYLSSLALAFLFLSSCSLVSQNNPDDWRDEILMAGECGEDGLMCCIEKDPPCKYGNCCVDPNNPKQTVCAESCDFGTESSFCREGNDCDEGLACAKGVCEVCGGIDQPCCPAEFCSAESATCFRGTCVECGVTGNPCCEGEEQCRDSDPTRLDRAECISEICTLCGANGNTPCGVEPTCNENHLLNQGICYRCGGFNQPCCLVTTPEKTTKYCVEEGLSCKLDFCSK